MIVYIYDTHTHTKKRTYDGVFFSNDASCERLDLYLKRIQVFPVNFEKFLRKVFRRHKFGRLNAELRGSQNKSLQKNVHQRLLFASKNGHQRLLFASKNHLNEISSPYQRKRNIGRNI